MILTSIKADGECPLYLEWQLLIKSPVILVVDGEEQRYSNGECLTALDFDKWYLVDSISARENDVVVTMKINDRVNEITWIGEEAVSFM